MSDTTCHFCGRKNNRNKMSVKKLIASRSWCKGEIVKINKRIPIQKNKEDKEKVEQQKNNM